MSTIQVTYLFAFSINVLRQQTTHVGLTCGLPKLALTTCVWTSKFVGQGNVEKSVCWIAFSKPQKNSKFKTAGILFLFASEQSFVAYYCSCAYALRHTVKNFFFCVVVFERVHFCPDDYPPLSFPQRLATQNQKLLSMYKTMKKELAATQKTVTALQSQLEHYQQETENSSIL